MSSASGAARVLLVLGSTVLTGCAHGAHRDAAPHSAVRTSRPSGPSSGAPDPSCVDGWTAAQPGSPSWGQALAALTSLQGASLRVTSVRYFTGPIGRGPATGAHYLLAVDDLALRARVLLVQTGDGPPSVAVAPATTSGWREGDWTGFGGVEASAAHAGVPGRWPGPAYDAVAGGLLPASVTGCLDAG